MLELKNVSYGEIIDGISLRFSGGITAVIGVNSAGKTTMLKCASGEFAVQGEVLLFGKNIKEYSPKEKARFISFLPQTLPSPDLTVREVVSFGLYKDAVRLSPDEWRAVDEALKRVGIEHLGDRTVSSLSGGERQKVFLCLILLQDAKIILLDEPTTYMDISFKPVLFRLLKEEADRGKTVVTVMHDLADAVDTADRIVLIKDGKAAFDGTAERCLSEKIIETEFSVTRYTAGTDGKEYTVFK